MATKKRTGELRQRTLKKLKTTFGAQITEKEGKLLRERLTAQTKKLKRRKSKSKRVSSLPTAPKRSRKKK